MISVIIPTYNREKLIIPCIESVLKQTYRDIEIIIVDDCSKDRTEEVLRPYLGERVIYHKLPENHGACYARNTGVKIARGELIAFQDSDDVWHPEKLAKKLACMEEERADLVFCGMNRVMPGRTHYYPLGNPDVHHDFYLQELKLNRISTQTVLVKKETAEKYPFDVSLRRYQDWDFGIRVSRDCRIGYVPEALVDSAVQPDSITATVKNYDAINVIYHKYYDEIKKHPEIEAFYEMMLGDEMRKSDPKTAAGHFDRSMKLRRDRKVFVKYILSSFGMRY